MNYIQTFRNFLIFIIVFLFSNINSEAKENKYIIQPNKTNVISKTSAGCSPPKSSVDLDINNVRARLHNGGDMWWDLVALPKYEVPKVTPGTGQISRHPLYASAIWLGGIDDANVLRTAGQTYRNSGSAFDFWPGAIDTTTGNIEPEDCILYDKHYKIDLAEIDFFNENGGSVPTSISQWPGNPFKPYQSKKQAPFVDVDGDGVYNPKSFVASSPNKSDYPDILGDQAIWWVINDVGNIHTKYLGQPIGIEIQTLAFAFSTSDAIDNMTFYRFTLINRGSNSLNSTYMAQWTDPDLGNAADDFVGVDVDRSFSYCYNGDAVDETTTGYGENPPRVGIDFFEGPFSDPNDGIDNDRDGVIDNLDTLENGTILTERIALSKFMYFNNIAGDRGDPNNDIQMYRYLTGFWSNGTPLSYGRDGFDPNNTDFADFAFPGTTDLKGRPKWSECTENNEVNDRRFVQSAGSFTLKPGAVNIITTGAVFAFGTGSGPCDDDANSLLLAADDVAQALFDNNFKAVTGPPVPPISVVELDKKLVISIFNTEKTEKFDKVEFQSIALKPFRYKFQGYKLYQVANSSVKLSQVDDPLKAALIYQGDIIDNVGTIINKSFVPALNNSQAVLKVQGANLGIKHVIEFTQDRFKSNNIISNNKQYFFLLEAYAYADSAFDDNPKAVKPYAIGYQTGQKNPTGVVSGTPRFSAPRFGGTQITEQTGVELKLLSGRGNGNNFVDLKNPSEVLLTGRINNPIYIPNSAPVEVLVYDPFKVPNAEFEIKFVKVIDSILPLNIDTVKAYVPGLERWILINKTSNDTVFSDTTLVDYQQVIPEYGISINSRDVKDLPGQKQRVNKNGFIGASLVFKDNSSRWLDFLTDVNPIAPATSPNNWIDQGSLSSLSLDSLGFYGNILNGKVAPYRFTSISITKFQVTPTFEYVFSELPSIDVIFTPDQSKWSKCIVIETGSSTTTNQGNQSRLNLRKALSIQNTNGDTVTNGEQGRGFFPGYAINTNTGERLNVFFGESSSDITNNGGDMKFNPTTSTVAQGGKHFIYVLNTKYDEGNAAYAALSVPNINSPSLLAKRNLFKTAAWTCIPLLASRQTLLSSEVKLSVRIASPYGQYNTGTTGNDDFPYYSFNTSNIAANLGINEVAKSALDLIRIVPNPYYGFSEYELSNIDNVVKITNLPTRCSITIYTTSGIYVTRLEKDDVNRNFVNWDLQNDKNVPVASGIYLIHIKADGIGEKVLKWFGVVRPTDLTNF